MPVISMFYGIVVLMYYFDNKKHRQPHVHVQYSGDEAVISIPDGTVLEGTFRTAKLKLVQAWIEIHQEELMKDWNRAVSGQSVFKIEPLR
jgi:hypothetical protein